MIIQLNYCIAVINVFFILYQDGIRSSAGAERRASYIEGKEYHLMCQ